VNDDMPLFGVEVELLDESLNVVVSLVP